jgi:large subunit ribosomal protein L6
MKKDFSKEIIIPSGIEVKIDDEVIIKGPNGENRRKINFGKIKVKLEKDKITLSYAKATKKEKKMINTLSAHLKNLIKGVSEKFEYKLKICIGHFPFTVKIEGKKAIIKNFLGERMQREAKIPEGAEVEINKDIIIIKSANKEIAGQAAANLESATRVRNRDRRIFQDGIYIINKCGKDL